MTGDPADEPRTRPVLRPIRSGWRLVRLSFACRFMRPAWAIPGQGEKTEPRTRTSRSHRSRSTNGPSGSAIRPRRRSTRRGSTRTPCRTSSARAGPSLKTRSWPASFRSRRCPSCSSSASRAAMSMSTSGPRKGPFSRHWPASKEHTGRLQWFGSDLTASPPANIPQSYLPERTGWRSCATKRPPCFSSTSLTSSDSSPTTPS